MYQNSQMCSILLPRLQALYNTNGLVNSNLANNYVVSLSALFIGNSPPQIMGPSMLRLDIGVTATLSFNISDDKDIFNITVVGGLPDNSELMSTVMDGFTEYEFTWTLSTVQSARSIMFEARDELNASAVLNVQVQICACMNKSDCTIEGIADATASSIVLNCECSEGVCSVV